jgi:hypothetical protein
MGTRTARTVALATIGVFGLETTALALDSKKAMYVGGTVTSLMPEKTEGTLDTTDKARLVFTPDVKSKVDRALELPYRRITSFEYGQKASHRIKTAIFLTPFVLFSKKRRHYLSLMYKDRAGKEQGVVLELGKDILRPTVHIIETRTGKKVEFQDEEAKKHYAK